MERRGASSVPESLPRYSFAAAKHCESAAFCALAELTPRVRHFTRSARALQRQTRRTRERSIGVPKTYFFFVPNTLEFPIHIIIINIIMIMTTIIIILNP